MGRDYEYNCCDHDNENITEALMGLQGFPDRVGVDDTKAQTVFPDIIVHHRDTNDNCLMIEIKKTSNARGKNIDLGNYAPLSNSFFMSILSTCN